MMYLRIDVTGSSQFHEMKYAGRTLHVTFKRHLAKWNYYDVPPEVIMELKESESKGKYFHANIKKEYESKKIS